MLINIVGLQHRKLPTTFVDSIKNDSLWLEREPNNSHDKFAVKCWSKDTHFGYVEQAHSRPISYLVSLNIPLNIKVISSDNYRVRISLKPDVIASNHARSSFECADYKGATGIYQIDFKLEGTDLCYVGQSIDISNRLLAHYRYLCDGSHHNVTMLAAWYSKPSSFRTKVLYLIPKTLSPLQRQITLFEKEIYFISERGASSANKIKGDLVMTTDSSVELKSVHKEVKKILQTLREVEQYKKEKLGKLILDVGIMQRTFVAAIQRGGGRRDLIQEVKDSNVLTWWNKKSGYGGPLDYVPFKNTNVFGCNELISKLFDLDARLKKISEDKLLLDNFIKNVFNLNFA